MLPGRGHLTVPDEVRGDSPAQIEVRERVITRYLPDWCAAQPSSVDASTLRPEWSFLTDGVARWFLAAVDEQIVTVNGGWPTLPDARRTYLFAQGRGRVALYREGFLEVAAAGVLAIRFGWAPEFLTFQSPRAVPNSRPWAFDLLAYRDGLRSEVRIAAEIKWRQSDVASLLQALDVCCARGAHSEDDCAQRRDNHRKYQGLLDHRPPILWLVGPDEFLSEPKLVFHVAVSDAGHVRLHRVEASQLAA
jgi:hypothetical protein